MTPLPARVPVSVLIPIRNEEANLPRCLASVRWAAEVFVVDSQSTDRSAAIAESHGARVVQFHFQGTWPKKKNWALETLPFTYEWVFILDADEVLPPEAEEEFREIVSGAGSLAGYWINRRFMFMGRWLRHSYYPNWNLRLFKHRLGRYEKLTEVDTQSGDNEVHEHVVVQGQTGRLRAEMDHYAFPSVEVFVEKHNRYSNWEARVALDRFLQASGGELQEGKVGLRRRLKRLSQRLPCRGLLRFLYIYIGQRGFLDGREGYYFARLHGVYELLSVAKTYELQKRAAPAAGGLGFTRLVQLVFAMGLGLVFYFALQTNRHGDRLHELPRPMARWLNEHDDLANFGVFAVMSLLAFALPRAPAKPGERPPLLSRSVVRCSLLLALVVGLELAQRFIPGRVSSLEDVATGASGVLTGWLLSLGLKSICHSHR